MLGEVLKVRLAPETLELVTEEAERIGVRPSTYVRMLVLDSMANAKPQPKAEPARHRRARGGNGKFPPPFNRGAHGLGKGFLDVHSQSGGVDGSAARSLFQDP